MDDVGFALNLPQNSVLRGPDACTFSFLGLSFDRGKLFTLAKSNLTPFLP